MATYTITGASGGAAILTGDIRYGHPTIDNPVLAAPALLFGDLRQTVFNIPGTIDVSAVLEGAPIASISQTIVAVVELDALWQHRWTSHDPVIGLADLEADASFVRLGDTNAEGVPSSIYGRVFGAAAVESGTLPLASFITGTIDVVAVLAQSFLMSEFGASMTLAVGTTLTGNIDIVGSRRSPPYASFDGTNFLARDASDFVLNPSGAFTVSVTFDPELILRGQDGVVIAKNNETDTQAGWKITYAATTGIVTFTVFGAVDGSISRVRPTSTEVRVRSRLTAIVDGSGNITLYVNGSTNQGTQVDTGSWTAPAASTEPFSVACDEPTNGGTNRITGAVYDVAFWSAALSGSDAALLLPNGSIDTAVDVSALEVYWDSRALVAAPANGTFAAWTDTVAGLSLAAGNPSGYKPIYCLAIDSGLSPSSPPLPITNKFSSLLADQSVIPPDDYLTTTHRLSVDTKWRLWNAGSITPQISGIFREYRGDATITVLFSRVSGAINIVVAAFYGIRIEWQTTNSLFVVSGADSVGSTNDVHNYVVTLTNGRVEPTESDVPNASACMLTVRFNSFTKTVDLFFQGTRLDLANTLTGQSAYEARTGLVLADFGDFRLASFIPACLSDLQIVQMLADFNPPGWSRSETPRLKPYLDSPFVVVDPLLKPFHDDQILEPIPLATSTTTISGVFAFASGGGIEPGSVTITVPNDVPGTMDYTDNGLGAFVAALGAQPVSSSSISYTGAQATGQISLSGVPSDGDTVTLTSADGRVSKTFEFDNDVSVVGGNVLVTIGGDASASAANLRAAINQVIPLKVTAAGAGATVALQHQDFRAPISNLILVSGVNLSKTDFAGGIDPGTWSITITGGGLSFDVNVQGTSAYTWVSTGLNPVPAPIPFDWIEVLLTQVYNAVYDPTDYLYADAPYIIKDGFDEPEPGTGGSSFLDPQPIVVSVVANSAHVVTAIANAGPTDAGPVIMWWEIELISGSTEVVVVADYTEGGTFSVNRNQTDVFPIPPGQDWNEKRIRFVILSLVDATQSWRSLYFRMLGDEFDNNPPEIVVVTGGTTTSDLGVEDLLTTQERERLVIARRSRRPTTIRPQAENSRYKLTKVFSGDRGFELGLMEVLDDLYTVGSDFRTYVVRSTDVGFLDRIAVLFFGEGFEWAWWAIAYVNNMVDPDQEMFAGQQLVIPPRSALQSFLARKPVTTLST